MDNVLEKGSCTSSCQEKCKYCSNEYCIMNANQIVKKYLDLKEQYTKVVLELTELRNIISYIGITLKDFH